MAKRPLEKYSDEQLATWLTRTRGACRNSRARFRRAMMAELAFRLFDYLKDMKSNYRLQDGFETIDDVIADTVLTVLTRVDSFQDRGEGSFQRWVRKIFRNRLVDRFRRQWPKSLSIETEMYDKVRNVAELQADDPAKTTLGMLEQAETRARLYEAIECMRPNYRDVALLYLQGLPVKAIARRLDCAPASVSRILYRVKRQIKSLMADSA